MATGGTDDNGIELRREWIKRVLHVDLARTGGRTASADLAGLWSGTKDLVDTQIEELRSAFLATGHDLASAACEAGLSAFSGGSLVRFQTALLDYKAAGSATHGAAAARVAQIGADLRGFITSNAMLPILERNPFGVRVTIRVEVPRAIDSILAQLPH